MLGSSPAEGRAGKPAPERFQHPARVITSGFGAIVAAGTLLLLLPSSSRSGHSAHVVDALFTATSAVCLTGWYEAQWYNGAFADSIDASISPGDIDEAVQFLLEYGVRDEVFPNVDASGFELVGAFRTGFLEGGAACDLDS